MKILSEMYLWTRRTVLNFGSHTHLDAHPRTLKDFSALRDTTVLHNLAHISEKADQIFMTILSSMCLWTRNSPLNFASHADPDDIRTSDTDSRFGPNLR